MHSGQRERDGRGREAGFTIGEVALTLAIIGILSLLATPMFLSYYQAARVRVGSEEIATFLNQGRQLAIQQNTSVCVHITSTAMHYHIGSCSGTTWVGAGTDSSGNLKAPDGITLSATADPIFNYLGAATTAATYTITNSQAGKSQHVVVAASGRANITP